MLNRRSARRPLTRVATALLAGALIAVLTAPWAAGATDEFVAGSGNSYAQVLRIGPTAGQLSLAPILGVALADYTDTVARAESEAADLAAIGVSSPCTDAKVPRLRVTSEDPGADKGKETIVAGQKQNGLGGGIGELQAQATKAPLATSSFKIASFDIPGVIALGGGHSTASSGLVTENGKQLRKGTADVFINEFDLGPVSIKGLHWSSVQTTDASNHAATSGSFTIGSASIAGIPLPVVNGDLNSVLGPINTALTMTGFAIAPPVFDKSGGVAAVSPLSIQIINSQLGRQFLGPVLGAIEPIREPLSQQLIPILEKPQQVVGGNPNDCSQTTVPDLTVGLLVADLGIGVAAGSSQLHIDLGGTNAYTEGEQFNNPFNFHIPSIATTATPPKTIVTPGTAAIPAIPGSTAAPPTNLAGAEVPRSDKTIPGGKGGIAIAVGLIGVVCALVLAGADWYWMRAHRTV
jgi:hypothetical protein